ncbi:unnamed protein product [Blepharisma stoltei]|uniref:Uncharacterized protein n=1 Tax=Blepharisma stoltei TaxID=1481888 RepID=A0AAU9K170_9CILI|nr:unnamed protein product [Blepharisma stoltei]
MIFIYKIVYYKTEFCINLSDYKDGVQYGRNCTWTFKLRMQRRNFLSKRLNRSSSAITPVSISITNSSRILTYVNPKIIHSQIYM